MIAYKKEPLRWVGNGEMKIASFVAESMMNADRRTVRSFGEEWNRFSSFSNEELKIAGDQYFDIVKKKLLGKEKIILDIGCGSGRWSKYISPEVKFVEAIDPGDAVFAAKQFTSENKNIRITQAGFGDIPFEKNSFDLVMSLGVVHHLPDTAGAINEAAEMVKPGGHLLLYIYYALDNRGILFRILFHISSFFRRIISSMPTGMKFFFCDLIAFLVYMPFVLLARMFRFFYPEKKFWKKIPLSYYTDKSMRIIRNDSLDRFGTPLEKRFSKKEIEQMILKTGMKNIVFSDHAPYWHVIAEK
ncbi:MAG: class I SAM-dependent methyltransferase [Bacteroidetes bacterium]|nr:class I SAM-dependent methyltransferase [Bacteroidota bacterium]